MRPANVRATHTKHEGPAYVSRSQLVDWLDDRIREHTTYTGDYVTKRERSIYITCRNYVQQMEIHV